MNRNLLIYCGLISIGTFNYFAFRPKIFAFKILNNLGICNNNPYYLNNEFLSLFVRNYLSDILWCAALIHLVLFLIEKNVPLVYCVILLNFPILTEILQLIKVLPGTFDWIDIIFYILILSIYFYQILKTYHAKNI